MCLAWPNTWHNHNDSDRHSHKHIFRHRHKHKHKHWFIHHRHRLSSVLLQPSLPPPLLLLLLSQPALLLLWLPRLIIRSLSLSLSPRHTLHHHHRYHHYNDYRDQCEGRSLPLSLLPLLQLLPLQLHLLRPRRLTIGVSFPPHHKRFLLPRTIAATLQVPRAPFYYLQTIL